ncbi:uroporphyrinogen-III synthase [Oceanobacillus iheyensis]|uniref:uroporphyrinogen-III synthase n=1 Tax=Oceanobacillus iheyensis TaxID=182710 RepID=UPI003643C0E6
MEKEAKRIGIAASRRSDEISALVKKIGGTPIVFSIQGEQILNNETSERDVFELIANAFDFVVLTTGIGASTLEEASLRVNRFPEFITKLSSIPLAIRGSKTEKWLKRHSLDAKVVSTDGTMQNLLHSLQSVIGGNSKTVFLQTYNEDDIVLKEKLENLGCNVYMSKPYRYRNPDKETIAKLESNIVEQNLEAVIFTSKTQVKNLFQMASDTALLTEAFNKHVTAVAVGKVTANQLNQYGVSRVVHPANQKMGAMVVELRDYLLKNTK